MSVVQTQGNQVTTVIPPKTLIQEIPDSKSPEPELEVVEYTQEIEQTQEEESVAGISSRAEKVRSILTSGDVVSAVLLSSDGSTGECKYDTTPSKHSAISILNSRPTIIGSIESINVIILRGLGNDSVTNKHSLPDPFNHLSYPGDYLLLKVNKDGDCVNFTKNEYSEYLKNADDVKTSDDDAVVSSQPAQSKLSELRAEVTETVFAEFKSVYGVDPTKEELDSSVDATLSGLIESIVNDDDSLDYTPATDESQFQVVEQEESTETNQFPELGLDEYGQHEFNEAIQGIKRLAHHQRDQIIRNVQKANGASYEEVAAVFADIGDKVLPESNEADGDEKECEISPAAFEKELSSALKNVRALGRKHGKQLACSIANTYSELNGVEPTTNDIAAVFERIKVKFDEEAEEELLDSDTDVDVEDDGSAAAYKQIIGDLSEANKADILEFARRIVREDLASKAHDSFLFEHGRTGSNHEIAAKVNELASAAFKDYDFGSDESDGDYDINDQDLEQEQLDEQANHAHEISSGYHSVNVLVAESNPNSSNLLSTPVKPVGSHGSVRVDFYLQQQSKEINELNYDKMVQAYKSFHAGQEPDEGETKNMVDFLVVNNNLMVNQFDDGEDVNDVDYDPSNENDTVQCEQDEKEDGVWEVEAEDVDFPLKDATLLHTKIEEQKGKYARLDFYFEQDGKILFGGDDKISKAKAAYKIFNNKDPNGAVVKQLKEFISTPNQQDLVKEEEEEEEQEQEPMVNVD